MSYKDINDHNCEKMHYVAVIGGSIAGSEAASMLADKGYRVAVFDQNALPYGKLEEGLPMWHVGLRDRQEAAIDDKLDHPNIRFIPLVQIGKDIPFDELVNDWGFSAIILANGAWDDRRLSLERIHEFEGKNLIYQNPFLYWFNHKHEPDYKGPQIEIKNNAIVLGGGLASIDVIKIIMIELVMKALKEKHNIDIDVFTMEKKGVKTILEENNLSLETLGIVPANLVYRRAAEDMPLAQAKDKTPEKIEKARQTSKKLIEKYVEKFQFNFIPKAVLIDEIIENDQFEGLAFRKVELDGRKLIPTEETFEIRSKFVVSSIGSVPKKIESLFYEGEQLKMRPETEYHVHGFDHVFAIGNAITGKGNIISSKKHGREMTEKIIDAHLEDMVNISDHDALEEKLDAHNTAIRALVDKQMDEIEKEILTHELMSEEEIKELLERTAKLNKGHHFSDYRRWIKEHKPVRLEDLLKEKKS
jgi:NADPH-dependent glutamate synthase beta subunit-like oxidoreductase